MNVNCGDPSWEVDILRDGVIVDSFILNKEVLPPRTNKKGKVVWKLPDNGDKLVSAQANANEVRNFSTLTKLFILQFSFNVAPSPHLVQMTVDAF